MAAAGCAARIIKLASGGMKESLLWANVSAPATKNRIAMGMSPFFEGHEFGLRGAILGEGGEYETLAVNGPPAVWKKRIEIESKNNIVVSGEGGTSHLRFGMAELVEQQAIGQENRKQHLVRVPILLDEQFSTLEDKISSLQISTIGVPKNDSERNPFPNIVELISPNLEKEASENTKDQISNEPLESAHSEPITSSKPNMTWTLPPAPPPSTPPPLRLPTFSVSSHSAIVTISNIAGAELGGNILRFLRTILHALHHDFPTKIPYPLTPDDIVFTTVLLSGAQGFESFNREYGKLFTKPNPPARVTLWVPEVYDESISVVLDLGPRHMRRGLHVQSRSYWAPANIGPYSQAISVPVSASGDGGGKEADVGVAEVVYVAGQIALVPHSMDILSGGFLKQAVLALQHLWRIGQEREVDWWLYGVAFLENVEPAEELETRARIALEAWRAIHMPPPKKTENDSDQDYEEQENLIDVWDLKHNPHQRRFSTSSSSAPPIPTGDHLHKLPNRNVLLPMDGDPALDFPPSSQSKFPRSQNPPPSNGRALAWLACPSRRSPTSRVSL